MDKMMLMLSFVLWLMFPVATKSQAPFPLDEMKDAIDDKFCGCEKEMAEKIKAKYLPDEMKDNDFKKAWNAAETCAKNKLNIIKGKNKDKELTLDHLKAICAYTYGVNDANRKDGVPEVYRTFNEAVRTSLSKYGTPGFKYHTLYFWLNSALEILRKDKECRTTYRRTTAAFSGDVNKFMRFGTFASSSKLTNLFEFGKKTCFHIKTCFGAYIKDYSYFDKEEREVLIPPYEKFKITKIAKGSYLELKDCETIFVLESVGCSSALNCKAAAGANEPAIKPVAAGKGQKQPIAAGKGQKQPEAACTGLSCGLCKC